MAARFAQWVILRRALLLLLIARLALGAAYSLINPPWEAYDEDGHFAYARYLARYHRLLQPGDPEAEAVWEKFQPPLYYALLAPALMPFDLGETFQPPERNPYMVNGDAGVNYAVRSGPVTLTPTVQALYVARLITVLISTLSVIAVHRLACRVWPHKPRAALAATALYAFWPQFLFIGSMVTNDALATALAALSLHAALALMQDGFRVRRALWLGVCLSAALLTKLNGFALMPMALAALALSLRHATRTRAGVALAALGALLLVAVLALNSFAFVTGQVFHSQTIAEFFRLAQTRTVSQQPLIEFAWQALRYGARTFFASLGWGNLEAPAWTYWLWALGAVLGLIGLGRAALRRAASGVRVWMVVLSLHGLSLGGLSLALAIAQQDMFLVPGRYLLPALPVVACGLILGWEALCPARWRPKLWSVVSVGVLLLGWAIPAWTMAPAYAWPRPLTGLVATPLNLRFGAAIELLGHQPLTPITPSQRATLTLCWRADAPITQNYSVLVEVVGSDGQGYGRLVTYPGRGNYATSLWEVGRAFCDAYALSVGANIPAPSAAEVQVSLLTMTDVNGGRLSVTDATNNALGRFVSIPIKVAGGASASAALPNPTDIRFGDVIRLRGYDVQAPPGPQRRVLVTFQWEALKDPAADYAAFVHLRDTPNTAYAQADGAAQGGRYPTAWWTAGEVVLDPRAFVLPDYTPPLLDLYVGWLDSAGNRLPAFDAQGQPLPNNEALLARGLSFAFPTPAPTPVYTEFIFLPMIVNDPTPPNSTPYP